MSMYVQIQEEEKRNIRGEAARKPQTVTNAISRWLRELHQALALRFYLYPVNHCIMQSD
jgi:hypothetical protein